MSLTESRMKSAIKLWLVMLLAIIVFPGQAAGQEAIQAELESCFKYYDYGKVKVNLGSNRTKYSPGENMILSGTINNLNSFPIRNAVLYAQLKRVNSQDNFSQNGHYFVDRITLLNDLNLLPGESRAVKPGLAISKRYPAGDYQLQYFVFSEHGFNYAGRNFLEEDMAGVTNFSIENQAGELFYFDPNSLTVNGINHYVRETLSFFPKRETFFSVNLADIAGYSDEIKAEYYIFDFDDALGGSLVTKGEKILKSADNYSLDVNFIPPAGGAYVFQAVVREPVKSILKYRFVIEGNDPSGLRMNDMGITNYPPGEEDRAYMCFHSATDRITPLYTVRLELMDKNNNPVEEKTLQGRFGEDVNAISIPLDRLTDKGSFKLKGELISQDLPGRGKTVEISYSCGDFDKSIKEIDLAFDKGGDGSLTVEGYDGCGEAEKLEGTVDHIRVFKEGKLVKEDYNNELEGGKYNLGDLPGGKYSVEVKKGDQVKVLSIAVTKKDKQGVIILIFAILLAGAVFVILLIKKSKKTKGASL